MRRIPARVLWLVAAASCVLGATVLVVDRAEGRGASPATAARARAVQQDATQLRELIERLVRSALESDRASYPDAANHFAELPHG